LLSHAFNQGTIVSVTGLLFKIFQQSFRIAQISTVVDIGSAGGSGGNSWKITKAYGGFLFVFL